MPEFERKSMRKPSRKPAGSFDVTCVIGTVELDGGVGGLSPHEAAFLLIAQHDAPGTYQFPMPDGRTMAVTVDHEEVRS